MENKNTQLTQWELIGTLVLKCWEDDSFKQKLKLSPRATIGTFLGRAPRLSEDFRFIINDQEETAKYFINIPPKPNLDVELTDNQLEQVAGGTKGFIVNCTCEPPAM